MEQTCMPDISSVRRQQLLLEFARFKRTCPEGIYVSLTPGDPTLWSAVLFVRTGPYSPALIRFIITFPPTFPKRPPLIIFTTDIFHPLIVPLTTHTFSTGSSENEPVSATDEGRLPPGGFSLRHGFPSWFERNNDARRKSNGNGVNSREHSVSGADDSDGGFAPESPSPSPLLRRNPIPAPPAEQISTTPGPKSEKTGTSVSTILTYVVSSFVDAELLDVLPLEVAGNPGAWHAWRSYRKLTPNPKRLSGVSQSSNDAKSFSTTQKQPGEWNWEGVWEKRVKIGIENSLTDPVLFGDARRGADEMIHFVGLDDENIDILRDAFASKAAAT